MNEGRGGRFAHHAARSGRQDSEPSSDKGGGTSGQHTHSPSGGWGWAGMTGVAAAVRRARLIVGWMFEWVSVRSVGSGQWDRPHTRAREVFAREGELGREPTDAGRGGGRTVACSCPQRARRAPIPTHIHSLAPSQSTGAAGAARRPPRGIERPRRSTVPPIPPRGADGSGSRPKATTHGPPDPASHVPAPLAGPELVVVGALGLLLLGLGGRARGARRQLLLAHLFGTGEGGIGTGCVSER